LVSSTLVVSSLNILYLGCISGRSWLYLIYILRICVPSRYHKFRLLSTEYPGPCPGCILVYTLGVSCSIPWLYPGLYPGCILFYTLAVSWSISWLYPGIFTVCFSVCTLSVSRSLVSISQSKTWVYPGLYPVIFPLARTLPVISCLQYTLLIHQLPTNIYLISD